MELLRQKFSFVTMMPRNRFLIADSFPIAVCKFVGACYCRVFRALGEDYARHPSKKETHFGYEIHAMATLKGCITVFEITSASMGDTEEFHDIADGQSSLAIPGDKGYVGETLAENLSRQGICFMALRRSNSRTDWSRPVRQLIFRLRRHIMPISALCASRNISAVRSRCSGSSTSG